MPCEAESMPVSPTSCPDSSLDWLRAWLSRENDARTHEGDKGGWRIAGETCWRRVGKRCVTIGGER